MGGEPVVPAGSQCAAEAQAARRAAAQAARYLFIVVFRAGEA
jgi:hypothetical protein